MQNEVLIKVEGLSKKFSKDLKSSLWYGLKDMWSAITGNTKKRELRKNEFWALQDINFELGRGECLGLIGHNGAGKSTLLKILNGLINPDEGKVTIKGRVGALIELGAGFNPILTGRENIYNNGAILGFTKQDIDAKVEQIIDFAEIREFIDMPVQNYSSGMRVRLGFAVASQMEPDVLLIDEVLAVGDIGFRTKCLNKIGELLPKCCAIFVSHSMTQINRVSTKIFLLNRGVEGIYTNNISVGIEKYYEIFYTVNDKCVIGGNRKVDLIEFKINDEVEPIIDINFNSKIKLDSKLKVSINTTKYFVSYAFIDTETKIVANNYSYIQDLTFNKKGIINIISEIPNLNLTAGIYTLSIAINEVLESGNIGEVYYYNSNIGKINITKVKTAVAPVQFISTWIENKEL